MTGFPPLFHGSLCIFVAGAESPSLLEILNFPMPDGKVDLCTEIGTALWYLPSQ